MVKRAKSKISEWQKRAKQGGECARCGKYTSHLTVDHIVPKYLVEMLDETGEAVFEDEDNFQMLCPPCNRFKGNSLDKRDSRAKKVLYRLLDD